VARNIVSFEPEKQDLFYSKHNNSLIFEKRVCDLFCLTAKYNLLEIEARDSFGLVIESREGTFSMANAEKKLMNLHLRWLDLSESSTCKFAILIELCYDSPQDKLFEVCPLISYAGEGLESLKLGLQN